MQKTPEDTGGCLHKHLDYWQPDKQTTICQIDQVVSSTGAPLGTVLSPFVFTFYISDLQFKSGLMDSFLAWCENNHLILYVSKTKEIIVIFRRARIMSNNISIMGEWVGGSGGVQICLCSPWQQTGDATLMLSARRSRADFTSWGNLGQCL